VRLQKTKLFLAISLYKNKRALSDLSNSQAALLFLEVSHAYYSVFN
jgi:hypothetical protein